MNKLGTFGAQRPLCSQSGMPQMGDALQGWLTTIQLVNITQSIVNDGEVSEKASQISFEAVVQPLSPRTIALKPEGQRDWKWLQLHLPVNAPFKLKENDRIMYNCCIYKIMADRDYSAEGYIEYHAVQDFQK